MNQKQIINRIKRTIHTVDLDAEAYLFGSRARGDHNEQSDFDILILVDVPTITDKIEDKFRNKLYDIELDTGKIISTFIYTKDYWKTVLKFSPLYESVEKEGISL